MINILFKRGEMGELSLVFIKDNKEDVLLFDMCFFSLEKKANIDLTEFEPLLINKTINSLDEIRNEDTDLFYLKLNQNMIFQISWIPFGDDIRQRISFYDEDENPKLYRDALKWFLNAEIYENLKYSNWNSPNLVRIFS